MNNLFSYFHTRTSVRKFSRHYPDDLKMSVSKEYCQNQKANSRKTWLLVLKCLCDFLHHILPSACYQDATYIKQSILYSENVSDHFPFCATCPDREPSKPIRLVDQLDHLVMVKLMANGFILNRFTLYSLSSVSLLFGSQIFDQSNFADL